MYILLFFLDQYVKCSWSNIPLSYINRLVKSRIKWMVFIQYMSIPCNSLRITILNYLGYKKFGIKFFFAQYNMFSADKWLGVIIEHFNNVRIAASISIEPMRYQIILWSRQQDFMQLNILYVKYAYVNGLICWG